MVNKILLTILFVAAGLTLSEQSGSKSAGCNNPSDRSKIKEPSFKDKREEGISDCIKKGGVNTTYLACLENIYNRFTLTNSCKQCYVEEHNCYVGGKDMGECVGNFWKCKRL
eukprot:615725_1